MEDELKDINDHSLESVEIEFLNTSVDQKILKKYSKSLPNARSVAELNSKIMKTLHKLDSLGIFKNCDVKVLPGPKPDHALVSFILKEHNWWTMQLGLTSGSEGGKTETSGSIWNLRNKADKTSIKLEFNPYTKTFGYQFSHCDKLTRNGKWETEYSIKQGIEELDTNLKENNYGGYFSCTSRKSNQKFEVGRVVRTNSIRVENSSLKLIKETLPVNAKNYVRHTFTKSTLDDYKMPKSGSFLSIVNEFAYGADNRFHKLDLKYHNFFGITSNIILQSSAVFGCFVPWSFTKTSVNDRYRIRYVKGFNSIGTKALSASPKALSTYLLNGDDLGKTSNLSFEAKIHFFEFPGLFGLGLVPFIYGNLFCESPGKVSSVKEYYRDFVRASAGFGLGWSTFIGKVQLVYVSKVLSRPGDLVTEFQVILGD